MGKSETPIKDKTPSAYESGAAPAQPAEPLSKSDNWSTADYTLQNIREQAYRERLQAEQKHMDAIYPFFEPRGSFTSKERKEK